MALENALVFAGQACQHDNRNRLGFDFPGSNPLAGRRRVENLSGFLLSGRCFVVTYQRWAVHYRDGSTPSKRLMLGSTPSRHHKAPLYLSCRPRKGSMQPMRGAGGALPKSQIGGPQGLAAMPSLWSSKPSSGTQGIARRLRYFPCLGGRGGFAITHPRNLGNH